MFARLKHSWLAVSLIFAAMLLSPFQALAQTKSQASPAFMKVGVYVSPPFVVAEDDHFAGMAIDLWDHVADDLGFVSDYTEFPTFKALVSAIEEGAVDIGVTNLTVTRERAERVDFTQPWFDAGLRIMTAEGESTGAGKVIEGLRSSGHIRGYAWIALVILVASLLLTLFDRRFDKDFPRRWRDGLANSFHTVMSVAVSGRMDGRKNLFGWMGKIWQGIWLVLGVAVIAYVTSSITSVMTTLSLTSQINSLADLPGKRVGVFSGSVAEAFASTSGFNYRSYENIDTAAKALANGHIDAVVGDAPVLEYFSHNNASARFTVVGPIFEPDKYAFALPRGSTSTLPITIQLLDATENGYLEKLDRAYFGETGE